MAPCGRFEGFRLPKAGLLTETTDVVDRRLGAAETTQLVSLRLMLEDATRESRAVRRFRRAAAVVALDATVERACWLVAVSRGMPISAATKLDVLISQLRQELAERWKPKVLPEIRHLHRARNSAQHEGLEPDREQVPQWVAAALSFVESLVEAQFGVDLRTVVLADAIINPDWSALLREAETALTNEDFGGCVKAAYQAHSEALAAWMRLRGNPHPLAFNPFDPLHKELAPVNRRVDAIEEMLQSLTFAADPAQAEWFQSVVRATPDHVTRDEAERAQRYAFDWVAGFELASADWVVDRARLAAIAARLVRSGDSSARVHSVLGVQPHGDGWGQMTIRCADVPTEAGFDAWQSALQTILAPTRSWPQPWDVEADGTVVRRFRLDDADVDADVATLASALVQAEHRVAESNRTRADVQLAAQAARSRRLADLAQQAAGTPDWVTAIDWQPTPQTDATRGFWYLRLSPEAALLTFPEVEIEPGRPIFVRDLLLQHTLVEQAISGTSYGIQLIPDLTTDELVSVLTDVSAVVAGHLEARQRKLDAISMRCGELAVQANHAVLRVGG